MKKKKRFYVDWNVNIAVQFFFVWSLSVSIRRYMVTEIGARDFGDTNRYNMLEVGYQRFFIIIHNYKDTPKISYI